jgi:hypothetical protein
MPPGEYRAGVGVEGGGTVIRTVLVLLSAITLSGCAVAERTHELTKTEIDRFAVPADQAKAFVFISESGNLWTTHGAFAGAFSVSVDGEPLGQVGSGQFLEIDLAPGGHEITVDTQGMLGGIHPPPITNNTLPGQSSFFALQLTPGRGWMVSKVSPDFGMRSVVARTRHGEVVQLAAAAAAPPVAGSAAASLAAAPVPAQADGAALAAPAKSVAAKPDPLASLHFAKGPSRPDDVAVIIGNAAYSGRDIPPVPPARNDAAMMRRYVAEALGMADGNVIALDNATSAQMVEVFGNERDPKGKLYNWVKPGKSRVFVYYAGHGAPSGPGGSPMLVPVDASATSIGLSGYRLDTLYANLAKLPAESVTVVLEACFSGGSEAGSLVPAASPVSIAVKPAAVPGKLTVIAAGAADQIASWEPDRSHGLFTEYFLKGMAGEADQPPTGNGDGTVALDELGRYLDQNVSYMARRYYGRDQTVRVSRGQ